MPSRHSPYHGFQGFRSDPQKTTSLRLYHFLVYGQITLCVDRAASTLLSLLRCWPALPAFTDRPSLLFVVELGRPIMPSNLAFSRVGLTGPGKGEEGARRTSYHSAVGSLMDLNLYSHPTALPSSSQQRRQRVLHDFLRCRSRFPWTSLGGRPAFFLDLGHAVGTDFAWIGSFGRRSFSP